MNDLPKSDVTPVEGVVVSPADAVVLVRAALRRTRRRIDRDRLLLTLNGVSIPAAWVALWFVLAHLVPTE